MRIAVAIHDPVWTLPSDQAARLEAELTSDEIVLVDAERGRLAAFADADVIFAYRLAPQEFDAGRRLKWIHSPSTGVGAILTPRVVRSGVVVTNSRGVHSEVIAEHALALVLALRRLLPRAIRRQATRDWAQLEMFGLLGRSARRLQGATLLVAGLGTIGGRAAELASALGMLVIGLRRDQRAPLPPGVSRSIGRDDLLAVLPETDVVVLALPATPDTEGLIGVRELSRMKRSAVLVNVGRGELVDEMALVRALQDGRLAGAGLDTFVREPLPADHPLWDLPNVLITPHVAPFGGEFWPPLVDLFLENVARYRAGQDLLNVVDKRAGY